ncbi:MAG: glycosidase, partial [Phycisphaeraceae bacterium]
KDVVVLPERCGGRYVALHRPEVGPIEHIWSAYSNDLLHWGEPHCVLPEGVGPAWDAVKVGAGPPPILTERGWLLLYHGVKHYAGGMIYRVGVALLDREAPHRLVLRAPDWIFQADEPYERTGFAPGTVFPTGLIQRGDELWMYYGASDACVGLAVTKLPDLMAYLERE